MRTRQIFDGLRAGALGLALALISSEAAAQRTRGDLAEQQANADVACWSSPRSPARYSSSRAAACLPVPACASGETFFSQEERCAKVSATEADAARCVGYLQLIYGIMTMPDVASDPNSKQVAAIALMGMAGQAGLLEGARAREPAAVLGFVKFGESAALNGDWSSHFTQVCVK